MLLLPEEEEKERTRSSIVWSVNICRKESLRSDNGRGVVDENEVGDSLSRFIRSITGLSKIISFRDWGLASEEGLEDAELSSRPPSLRKRDSKKALRISRDSLGSLLAAWFLLDPWPEI